MAGAAHAMSRVLIADAISPKAVAVFEARGIEADDRAGIGAADLAAAIGEYEGLVVRSRTKVTAKLLDAAKQLKVVGRAGIGVDNIDVDAATQHGVAVMNTPYGNAITTAEHAIALLFALARQIPQADRSTQAGKWEKARFMGVEVTGKHLGIIGCGNIGSIVAERAQGLRMRVIAYDPFLSPERAHDLGIDKVELDTLFERADFVSLHAPLTDATREIINAKSIAKMKPGVRIINCARGGLVDEAALKEALVSGHVAGAALDVFSTEPARENVLFGLDNVVATPHLGASTSEAQEKVALQVAEQISDFLLNGAVVNAVNMPLISAEEAPKVQSYMRLAHQLGSFAGHMTRTGLRAVSLEYHGQVAALNTQPITAVALQGLLAPLLESVNIVNAPAIARERNIAVSEHKHERAVDYQTLICLTVTTEKRSRSIAGTLFGGDKPRIVEIEGVPIEAELGPHMLFITNKDVPGIIGAVGTVLADANVNIATFHLGRAKPGGKALALIEVDERLKREVINKVRDLPNVTQAMALSF